MALRGCLRGLSSGIEGRLRWPWIPAMVLLFLAIPADAFAWGIGTHLYISRKVADAVALSGNGSVSSLVLSRQAAFMLGNIIPDIFAMRDWLLRPSPPFVHGWETAKRLLKAARNEDEASFALGYFSHLSADVICHNFFIPQHIFMSGNRMRAEHILAETRVDGGIGHPWRHSEVDGLFSENRPLAAFFLRTAGLKPAEFTLNSALLRKAISLKARSGVDSLVYRLCGGAGGGFGERAERHIDLSVNLAAEAVTDPLGARSLGYCPEGFTRISLSKRRRSAAVRSKSAERLKREIGEGRYEYIHRVPESLAAETV